MILVGLTSILSMAAIFVEGFSTAKLTGVLIPFLCLIYVLPHSKLVRVTFAMQPDDIEDRLAQAMAAIGFTIEPNSQLGHSFIFRSLGSRLRGDQDCKRH